MGPQASGATGTRIDPRNLYGPGENPREHTMDWEFIVVGVVIVAILAGAYHLIRTRLS